MSTANLQLETIKPAERLVDYVESFWMIRNDADLAKEIVILPDGRFDIIFSYTMQQNFSGTIRGLDTRPNLATVPAKTVMFAISFKLLAIEYLLDHKMASVLNQGQRLETGFWKVTAEDLGNFTAFCEKVTAVMCSLLKTGIDSRKQKLFNQIYTTNGTLTVHEMADRVGWSSRQINRYFNEQFGISLKAFCNILRFRASLQQIKDGRLFPEQNFTDQTHFIKEIKKYAGVVPKDLFRNENDRFILLSALPKK